MKTRHIKGFIIFIAACVLIGCSQEKDIKNDVSEAVAEVTPETTPEITPKTTPEATPEELPDTGLIEDIPAENVEDSELKDTILGEVLLRSSVLAGTAAYEDNSEYQSVDVETIYAALNRRIKTDSGELIGYVEVDLSEKDSKKYAQLAETLDVLAQVEETDILNISKDFNIKVIERAMLRRADSRVVSLIYCMTCDGSETGTDYCRTENINTETGKILSLSSVVTDVHVLPELMIEQFKQLGKEELLYPKAEEYIRENLEHISWALDYNGITFFFNRGQIASKEAGIQAVTLPYQQYQDVVKEQYQKVPKEYAVELPGDVPFCYDWDNDGQMEEVTVRLPDEYTGSCRVCIGKNEYEYDTYAEMLDVILIHTKNGKNSIYISQSIPENGKAFLYAGSIIDDQLEINGEYTGYLSELEKRDGTYSSIFSDFDGFALRRDIFLIEGAVVYQKYSVGEDGMPVTSNGEYWYWVDKDRTYTLLRKLDAIIVNEKGEEIGRTVLQAGEKVRCYRTDCESYVHMKLTDGRTVRIWVDNSDWPVTVNGIDVEEVFDGLIIAG